MQLLKSYPVLLSTVRSLATAALLMTATGSAHALGGSFLDEFNQHDYTRWHMADQWANGGVFNVGWRADHVTFGSGVMTLRLDDVPCQPQSNCSNMPYASGEYRTNDKYHYGRYEVRMMPARGSGLVSSFFTYTSQYTSGPWHDEIDIEFLGKNTRQVHLNYYARGTGNHEKIIDLPFDAADGFHNYAFEWGPTYIRWYVDGTLVHSVTGTNISLPSEPSHIMMNLWAGTGTTWTGPFTYTGPVYAHYAWVRYTQQ